MVLDIILFITAFAAIWLAARLIITTVCDLSHLLRLSTFAVSFFILGLSTSLPEIFISASAFFDRHPEIFVGTLLGGTIVIFLFVIPLLAILGNGILTDHQLKQKPLVYSLFVIFLPFLTSLDGELDRKDGLIMIAAYGFLFYLVEYRKGFLDRLEVGFKTKRRAEFFDLLKILGAAVILFFASQILVIKTLNLAGILGISPFIISILLLALGTDIPETSVALVSALKKPVSPRQGVQKTVAMGDYLGSASANTLVLGVLSVFYGNFHFTDTTYLDSFLLFLLGLILFFVFSRSKNNLSRGEGLVLLALYAIFILLKIS